ncbi:uncharacterized protein LOC135351492 isoform X2 [Halichondria panicea]|uniref:uncharacterized protein LOC135351492 isoform X2 n=1 Tax=Halichondria panicea TaxID=6063 RepID=UPI00312B425C
MNRAPSLGQKLSNVQHMPVLITATSASKDAPEGFILRDIIKMSFDSTATRVFLQQYLVNELCSTNNVFVKLRVLRCITAVLDEGHIEFKQNLRKVPQPFNEASKLRPHQPKSESLVAECGRIRDMASRILDMLYEDTPELRRKPAPSVSYNDSNSTGQSQSSESSNRITGFGNSSYTPPSQQPTTSTKLKKLFGVPSAGKTIQYDPTYVTMDPVPHLQNTTSAPHTGGRYQAEGDTITGKGHVTGKAGGGWDDHADSSPETVRVPRHEPTLIEEPQNGGHDLESTSTEQEKRLVDDITAPGGIKAAPPREMLVKFVSRCRVLDCQSVVEYLRLKLGAAENQVVLRALFVIEALSRSDLPDMLSYLDLVLEELSTLSQAPHTTIRTKANKILMQLNAQNVQAAQYQPTERQSSNQTQSSTILDIGGGAYEEIEKEETVVSQEQSELAASLFSGMSVSGEKKSRPKPVKQVKKPVKQVKPVAPPSSFEDLLGLNDGSSQDAPPTQHQAPPTQPQAPPTHEESLLGSGEDSLIEFEGGGDEDFDPLKRTARSDSIRSNRANSLSTPQVAIATVTATDISLVQPAQSSSNGLLGDLAGVDLSNTSSSMSTPPTAHREQPFFAALQPLQPASMSGGAMTSGQPLINTGNTGYPQQQGGLLNQGGILYAPVGQAYGGGVAQGGGVPMMYMPMTGQQQRVQYGGQPGMVVGGEARPVQRAASMTGATAADTPTSDSGFSFLGKSNKGSAFDFVKDEMHASKNK